MLGKHHAKNKNKNKQLKHSNGFFIEAGAGDGEIISNSLYFELRYQVRFLIDTCFHFKYFQAFHLLYISYDIF